MATLQAQLEHLRHDLQCSATLDYDTPHLRVCSLGIPWCGRQLRWQLLLPAAGGAPDLVFDDDSFRPLCDTPPANPSTGSVEALRSLLLHWPSPPSSSASSDVVTAGAGAGAAEGAGGGNRRGSSGGSGGAAGVGQGPTGLSRLAAALLEAYRSHQAGRLEAAAARLPRLQFELSTLGLGPGVQLELTAQQACFAVPLASLDLRRLLDLVRTYGGRLPQPPTLTAAAAAPSAAGGSAAGAAAGSLPGAGTAAASGGTDGDDILEPIESDAGREAAAGGAVAAGGAGPAAAAAADAGWAAAAALPPLMLHAAFRLPTGAGADLADPELTLQLPAALAALQAPPTPGGPGQRPPSAPSASATSASSASPSSLVPLVPALSLPPWSPHMCLAEYVPLAAERLAAQIEAHCGVLEGRQQLLSHLSDLLGPPLELHPRAGSALFSLAWEGCPLLLAVELPPRFPADKPVLTLHGVRLLGLPEAVRSYSDYPWSPRWAPREMAARIYNWLREELPAFTRGRAQQ